MTFVNSILYFFLRKGGYDVTIGTSERGKVVDDVMDDLPEFRYVFQQTRT